MSKSRLTKVDYEGREKIAVDATTITIIAAAVVLTAIGITVGLRLLPLARRAKRDLAKMPTSQTEARIRQDQTRIQLLGLLQIAGGGQ